MLNLRNEQFKVGIYIRLSREDGDKQESESIGNQRNIIRRFLQDNELNFVDEYVDDGVSGTTFDRKGFNRLIQDVEAKRVNMIVTKDLSRLGRDYIKTGYYLENYFPEKNVRYVAILDGIDTYFDTTNNDITPFKAIMNDMYAKDISKKIKSVYKEKQKNGQFMGSIPPYGYKLNKEQKGKLEVDEEVEDIVKEIFTLYSNGKGSIDIANYLNSREIPNPSTYRKTKYKNKKSSEWNQITILAMLRNEVYIGNTVQNKRKKLSYKSKKIIDNPKEQWITVEDTHKAIIDKETFKKVQLMLEAKDTSKFTRHEYLFKGLLKCKHCGRNLQIVLKGRSMYPYINCIGHERRGKHPICINYYKFEKSILEVIRNICRMYLDENLFIDAYKRYKNNYISMVEEYKKRLNEVQDKIQNINTSVDKMYIDKLNGIISTEDYMRFYNRFSNEKKELTDKQYDLKKRIIDIKAQEEQNVDNQQVKDIINEFLEMKEIDKVMLYRLINYIEIDTNKNIYIHFNFNHLNILSDSLVINNGNIEYEEIMKIG